MGLSRSSAAVVGSYFPRQCGIATFSKDLRDAVAAEIGQRQASVVAIDDIAAGYAYPDEVRFQIPQHKQVEYISAADLLNVNQIDCVLLQHEYGIYGGKDGSQVLEFARTLRMPIMASQFEAGATRRCQRRMRMRLSCSQKFRRTDSVD